jgi:hypothetical protein
MAAIAARLKRLLPIALDSLPLPEGKSSVSACAF